MNSVLHELGHARSRSSVLSSSEREGIHVHRERPIAFGTLERDPNKPIGLSLQALLRQRGTKDIAKQSLTPDDIERARTGSRVERKAIERRA